MSMPSFRREPRRLSRRKEDASPGNHTHNGLNSKRLYQTIEFDENTNGSGEITVLHDLGSTPVAVFVQITGAGGGGNRGFHNVIPSLLTDTEVVIRNWDSSNTILGGGVNLTGYVSVFK